VTSYITVLQALLCYAKNYVYMIKS